MQRKLWSPKRSPRRTEDALISMGGALMSPDDPDDHIFEHLAHAPSGYYLAELPETFDLRKYARPSRNQGLRGTCAAFTGSTIKEIQENRESGFAEWMSPEFIYYHRENKPASGMYGRNVFQILQRIGAVPESLFPYRREDGENIPAPSAELYEIAAQFKIANYARVTTCDGLKRALIELGPCYIQLPLYSLRANFWKGKKGEKCISGHAATVIGYNRIGFLIQNSWGSDWNGEGTIIFPYSDWGIHRECWVSVDDKTDITKLHTFTEFDNLVGSTTEHVSTNTKKKRVRKIHTCWPLGC